MSCVCWQAVTSEGMVKAMRKTAENNNMEHGVALQKITCSVLALKAI
jgi:hypothetical protein